MSTLTYKNKQRSAQFKKLFFSCLLTFFSFSVFAAAGGGITAGADGLDQAADGIREYAVPITNLAYAIGLIVGLIGAIRVYIQWNAGNREIGTAIMGWFGAALFLIISGAVIGAFFGGV